MSTNPVYYSHRPSPRGVGNFDAGALRGALAELETHAELASPHLTDYRAYYDLQFPHTPHSHTLYWLEADGERVAVQLYMPQNVLGHVLLCHGYYDHVGLFGHAIAYLMHRGLAVVAYDQIGHGLSTGVPVTIESFDRYVAATKAVYEDARARLTPAGEAWHWFGQSMGGAVIMEYLQQHHPAEGVGEIVLFAPLVRPYAWWLNRWVFAIAKRTITERPRLLTNNAENAEFHALQEVDPLQARILPVAWVQAMVDWYQRFERYPASPLAPKLLQGDADRTVDWRYNIKMYERRYPGAMHLIIPGGRHHLVNESLEIRQQMWGFLDANCAWDSSMEST